MSYSTAIYQWGKKKNIQALSTGLGAEVARMKQTHAAASGGMGTRHVVPCKVLLAPLLLLVKLQTISQPHSWQGLGPNPGARVARHCHTGEAAPRRYQDGPGGRKPRADPASGAPESGNAAFHHETSMNIQSWHSPAAQ